MKLRFVSTNEHKIQEVTEHLNRHGIDVQAVRSPVQELQIEDLRMIVRDKCRKAFALVGHPVVVEHTGLSLDSLNGLPGGLTQIFWDRLEADRFAELFGRSGIPRGAVAVTVVGYCDGARITVFEGRLEGTIASNPSGSRDFQWDCVFVPKGETRTLAELGPDKFAISMRTMALDNMLASIGVVS